MKTSTIVNVLVIALIAGIVIQFLVLPADVWSSTISLRANPYNLPGVNNPPYLVKQEHIVEKQSGVVDFFVNHSDLPGNSVIFLEGDPAQREANGDWRVPFPITPNHAGVDITSAELYVLRPGNPPLQFLIPIPVDVSPSLFHRLWLSFVLFFLFSAGGFLLLRLADAQRQRIRNAEVRIENAEFKAASEPTKAKFAWDLARVKLEAYFDRNLFQVNQVFWLAVVMMAVGFGFILAAVVMSLNHPEVTPAAKVAALSGIITQFIGATFLVIYRSTMAQANEFMSVLERINTVGMAVQVLDSIPEADGALKNQTRAEIVSLLLAANSGRRTRSKEKSKESVK